MGKRGKRKGKGKRVIYGEKGKEEREREKRRITGKREGIARGRGKGRISLNATSPLSTF